MITSISRMVMIFDYLYKTDAPVGVSDIAEVTELPKATVFRLLSSLEEVNLIEKNEDSNRYQLGIGFIKYSQKITAKTSLAIKSKDLLEKLSEKVKESVNLSTLKEDFSVNIVNINHEASLYTKLLPMSPLYCSATGKIFLAMMKNERREQYLKLHPLVKRTEKTCNTKDAIHKELDFFYQYGYMIDDEEYEYGLYCIAVPLYHDGRVVAAISISGPKTRILSKGFDEILGHIRDTSQKISERIRFFNANDLNL